MNKSDFAEALRQLGLNKDEYIVVGSGVLCALGIRDTDDIDLVVSGDVFKKFEATGNWQKKYFEDGTYYLQMDKFEIGPDWDSKNAEPNLDDLKKEQLIIEDIPYVGLERLKRWKSKKGRAKDFSDIKLIEKYLEEHPN